jgi:hypothetical protein
MDAKELAFNLVKIGAMTPSQLVDHVDAPDPDELRASIMRRDVAKSEAAAQEQALKAQMHSGGGKKK